MKKYSLVMVCLTVIALAVPIKAQPVKKGTLTIKVIGLTSDTGVIRITLYNSKESFTKKKDAFKRTHYEIQLKNAVYEFKDLPYGIYAITVYQDKNNNGKLDTNFLGIPREPYGFSNNPSTDFGPADYENAKFEFASSKTIEIKLK